MVFLVKSIERFHCIGAADEADTGALMGCDIVGLGADACTTGTIGFDGNGRAIGDTGLDCCIGLDCCTGLGCCIGVDGLCGETIGVIGLSFARSEGVFGDCAKGAFGVCVSFIINFNNKIEIIY